MKASFTPNMEEMLPCYSHDNTSFLALLIDTAKRSKYTNFKLKKLGPPKDRDKKDVIYIEAASIFRQSLEELIVPLNCEEMDSVLNRLYGFKSLKRLQLHISSFQNVQKLDDVLKHCHGLCELDLTFIKAEGDDDDEEEDDYIPQDEADVWRWAVQNVEQVKTLKRLSIGKRYLDLVRYLVYKFPNMESFSCGGMDFYDEGLAAGLLNAAAKHQDFETKFYYHAHQELQRSITRICALNDMPQNVSVSFKYSIRARSEDYGASMAVKTDKRKLNTLHFGILLESALPDTVVVDILEHLQTTLDDRYTIRKLAVDAIFNRPWDVLEEDDGQLSFYYLINNFPDLKHLQLAMKAIQHQDLILNSQLETLKLQFAQIDAQVLPQISQQLPHLYLLDISNCSILDEHQQVQDDMHIYVPHSSLAILHIAMKREILVDEDPFEELEMMGYSFQSCYLQLTILDVDMTLYCRLEEMRIIVQLTQTQFEARPDKDETMAIIATCGSIARVHFDMGSFEVASSTSPQEDVTKELEDKERKYDDYLAKTKRFNEKLHSIPEPYSVYRCAVSTTIIQDVPANDSQ
ncbi:hypothetical protein MBANPS3_009773 [Mucor bainieri]